MQTKFKTKAAYVEWRAHWRKHYKLVAANIRFYKRRIKEHTNQYDVSLCRRLLVGEQMIARHLMMAREATDVDYALRASAAKYLVRYQKVVEFMNQEEDALIG